MPLSAYRVIPWEPSILKFFFFDIFSELYDYARLVVTSSGNFLIKSYVESCDQNISKVRALMQLKIYTYKN